MLPRSPKRKPGRPRKDAPPTSSPTAPAIPLPRQAQAHKPTEGKSGRRPGKLVHTNHVHGTTRIRYQIPSVARHVARVVVMNHMDYFRAVKAMLGEDREEAHIHQIANNIEKDPQVQKFILEELEVHGLDDASKESYLLELWTWFRHGPENKAMTAARILGRGFIAEKVETTKPEDLPISGIGDAVKSMLGKSEDAPTDDVSPASATLGDEGRPLLNATSKKPSAIN